MKGIRKLFFGLILMTLIGVGFKVDAKAAPTAKGKVYFELDGSNNLVDYFEITEKPDTPEDFYLSVSYKNLGGTEVPVQNRVKYSVSDIGKNKDYTEYATNIRSYFSGAGQGGTITYTVKAEFEEGGVYTTFAENTYDMTCYKITPQATLNGSTTGAPTVTFNPNTPQYKLKGDTLTVNITSTVPKTFSFNGWILGGENKGTSIPLSTTIPASLGVESYLNADYKESGASLTLSKDIDGAFLYPNGDFHARLLQRRSSGAVCLFPHPQGAYPQRRIPLPQLRRKAALRLPEGM